MNILIDFTQIPEKKTGVGTYAVHLLKEFAASAYGKRNRFYVLVQSDEAVIHNLQNGHIHFITVNSRIFRHLFARFVLEQLYIPWLIKKYQIDIIHSLHYSFPIFSFAAKKVVTIHDMTFYLFPEYHIFIKRHYFRFWIQMAAYFADAIITVSHSTRRDFHSLTGSCRKNVSVIPLSASIPDQFDQQHLDVKRKYRIPESYFIYIGTIEPRKNLVSLIQAFERIQADYPQYALVIVGGKGWKYSRFWDALHKSKVKNRIILTGYISNREKFSLLKHAKLFLYPSLYEGFGLPVLEALKMGVPTITSNVSSLPEISGDAALLIDPRDVDALYNRMKQLLSDPELYDTCRLKAYAQGGCFSWKKTAADTMKVYSR